MAEDDVEVISPETYVHTDNLSSMANPRSKLEGRFDIGSAG